MEFVNIKKTDTVDSVPVVKSGILNPSTPDNKVNMDPNVMIQEALALIKLYLQFQQPITLNLDQLYINLETHSFEALHFIDILLANSNLLYTSMKYTNILVLFICARYTRFEEGSLESKIIEKTSSSDIELLDKIYFRLKYVSLFIKHQEKNHSGKEVDIKVKSSIITYLRSIKTIFPECASRYEEWKKSV